MNSDVDQMHIVNKKSCALKSWARTMGDQIGAEMRLGAPPLVSGVHDELVVAALRGKGQTERRVQRTTYNAQRPSQCLSMVDKHLFSLTRKSQLNLLPKQWGLGTWTGDNQGLESGHVMSKNLKRAAPPSRCGHTGTRTSFERSIQKGEGWPYFSTPSVLLLFFVKSKAMSA